MIHAPRGILIAIIVGLGAIAGCPPPYYDDIGNGGGVVGGSCHDDRDCADVCLRGKPYPSGTCALQCDDDRDCPTNTWCIDRDGGVCLLACDFDGDCRHDYDCHDEDRRNADGDAAVCIHG